MMQLSVLMLADGEWVWVCRYLFTTVDNDPMLLYGIDDVDEDDDDKTKLMK